MKTRVLAVVVCVMAVVNLASADTIRGIGMDFVTIGNAGNAADTMVMTDGTTGYGAVGYDYRIGKYEVTKAKNCPRDGGLTSTVPLSDAQFRAFLCLKKPLAEGKVRS